MANSAQSQSLEIHEIDETPAASVRETLDGNHVEKLFGWIEEGVAIDAVTIYTDGKSYWLVDGRHRLHAHQSLGKKSIAVDIHRGKTFADAQQAAADANRTHKGLPMSKADLKCAVRAVVGVDPQISTAELHRRFGLARSTIEKLRQGVEPTPCTDSTSGDAPTLAERFAKRVGRDGKAYPARRRPAAAEPIEADDIEPLIELLAAPYQDALAALSRLKARVNDALAELDSAVAAMGELAEDPEQGAYVRDKIARVRADRTAINTSLHGAISGSDSLRAMVRGLEPVETCCLCDGRGCGKCRQTGFVPRGVAQVSAA